MNTITDRIKELEFHLEKYSEGYKGLTRFANELSEELRLVKKDIAAHSRAGITTRYAHQYMKGLSEEASGTRTRALTLKKLRNETFVSLYEMKTLVKKAGLELGK